MSQFVALIESGVSTKNKFDSQAIVKAVQCLEQRCVTQGRLGGEGVWRLHGEEVRALHQASGFRPPGGWRTLCALAVGTGVLRADEQGFLPGPNLDSDWGGDEIRSRLVESFTRWLIPPSTAAGLFLAMGVHPLWGLRLARRLHVDAPMMEGPMEGWRDESLLPDHDLDELRRGVFAALSVILSGLRKLDSCRRYGMQAMIGFVGEAIEFGCGRIECSGEGLAVLIDDVGQSARAVGRSREFAARELVDAVLVPAGVMRRYDDETFGIDADVLKSVHVGHLGRDAQRSWLQSFLVESPGHLVA